MTSRITPQLPESLVTTAPITVVFVTDWVLLVIVLMIILGWIELCGLHDLGYDRLLESFVLFQ